MNEISCQNCKYWNRFTESSESTGECRRRSPSLGALTEMARWPQCSGDDWCWEWRPSDKIRVPKLTGRIGRPKVHSEEAVVAALSVMTPSDEKRSFSEVLSLINIQLPMSRSVTYKFIAGLLKSGFLARKDGGYVRGSTGVDLD